MQLIVGDIGHIAFNFAISVLGLLLVLYRIGSGRLPKDVIVGFALVGLAFCCALVSQMPLVAIAYMSKLSILVFAFYFTTKFPRALVVMITSTAFLLFLFGLGQEGFGKLNSLPISELSLFTSILMLSGKTSYSPGLFRLTNLTFAFILVCQGAILGSRGSIVFGVLVVFFSFLPSRFLARNVQYLWLLPIAYVGTLAAIGNLFLSTHNDYLQPTKSNLSRTIMLSELIKHVPRSPFGVNQDDYTKSVVAAASMIDRKPYSSDRLDPHNFLGSAYMYSGWLGFALLIFLLRRSLQKITRLERQLPAVLVPLLGAFMTISVNPPSTWARLLVVCIFAVLISLARTYESTDKRRVKAEVL